MGGGAGRAVLLALVAALIAAPGSPAQSCSPCSTTEAATNVTATSVTLNGEVVPDATPTRFHFELTGGPQAAPYLTPDGELPADGQTHPVSANVTGLEPNTAYHYRLVSTGDSGATSSGADVAFTTPPAPSAARQSAFPRRRARTPRAGSRGRDCLTFLSTPTSVVAGAGDDTVLTGDFDDVVRGGPGDDELALGKGKDVAYGEAGDDVIYGDGQSIPPCRGAGIRAGAATAKADLPTVWNDRLSGGSGDDTIFGQAGDDRITGGPGRDRLEGGVGDDQLFARDGERDLVVCGPGRDVVHADPADRVASNCEIVVRPGT